MIRIKSSNTLYIGNDWDHSCNKKKFEVLIVLIMNCVLLFACATKKRLCLIIDVNNFFNLDNYDHSCPFTNTINFFAY